MKIKQLAKYAINKNGVVKARQNYIIADSNNKFVGKNMRYKIGSKNKSKKLDE